MFYDFIFNGYRLDHRNASRYDAVHADYKYTMNEGYYAVATPVAASLVPSLPQSNTMGTEYELWPIPSTNMTPVRHYLYEGTRPRTGIQVGPTFFYAARAIAGNTLDSLVVCVQYSAPWMRTALAEVGTKEAPGKAANKQILAYCKSAGFSTQDDTGKDNAWCASFVAWVMGKHGYALPQYPFRALNWKTFGKTLTEPVYGAIGIKSREGGGHVAFVVGKSADGKSLFMLGGNQDDMVSIAKYDRSVWSSFVAPEQLNNSVETLPIYTKPASASGSEA